MKKLTFFILTLLFAASAALSQSFTGRWKTVDDDGTTAKSYLEMTESGGKYYAKVTQLLDEPDQNKKCDKCPGERHMQPVVGMIITDNLSLKEGMLQGGKILDPEKGKWYTCKMWLKEGDPNTLVVRGYLFGFYRTQHWYRA